MKTLVNRSSTESSLEQELYVIDLFGFIFRSYYALLQRPMRSPGGQNTTCVYHIAQLVLTLIEKRGAHYIVAALESQEHSYRKELHLHYKSHRQEAPTELLEQIPLVLELLENLGIPSMEVYGYEADDVMASLGAWSDKQGVFCWILSQDKDLFQMLEKKNVGILLFKEATFQELLGPQLKERRGYEPFQVVDYLSLVGDTADNIPGVKGIGDKTAQKLLAQYSTLEGIYQHLSELRPAMQEKLHSHRQQTQLSRQLVQLRTDLPLEIPSLKHLALNWPHQLKLPGISAFFARLGMHSLHKRLQRMLGKSQEASSLLAGKEQGQLTFNNRHLSSQPEEPQEKPPANPIVYHLIEQKEELRDHLQEALKQGIVSFDTETDSLQSTAKLVGFSFAYNETQAFYVPVAHREDLAPSQLSALHVRSLLQDFFQDPRLRLVGHNFKFDAKILHYFGVDPPPWYFDTMLAAYVLDSQARYGLDVLVYHWLGHSMITFEDILQRAGLSKQASFAHVPLHLAQVYAGEDAAYTRKLYFSLQLHLQKAQLEDRFFHLEMPFNILLHRMELRGICLNTKLLEEYQDLLQSELHVIEQRLFTTVGYTWNIHSPKQLQEVLKQQNIPLSKRTKTGFSTDVSVLEELKGEYPLASDLLEFRLHSKLLNTYVKALPHLVNPLTGRLHTQFNQTGTATGRISSSHPNLQNVPLMKSLDIRRAFEAPPGQYLLAADYAQIELVVLAHLCQDANLLAVYHQGQDVHTQTAAILFNRPEASVSAEERGQAKTINFGIIYRMSPFRLAKMLGISYQAAKGFIHHYFQAYPGIKSYMQETIEKARETGYVTTLLGHKRSIVGLNSPNTIERQAAERIAINTPIQGSAADLVKVAMLRLQRRLEAEKKLCSVASSGAR